MSVSSSGQGRSGGTGRRSGATPAGRSGATPAGRGGAPSGGPPRPGGSRTQQRKRTADERAAAAAARREAERKRERRRRLLLLGGGAVVLLLVAAGITALVLTGRTSSSKLDVARQVIPTTPTGTTTVQKTPQRVSDHSGIKGVLAWDTGDWPGAGTSTAAGILEHDHVAGPVTYAVTPPVGGPHNATWMNAGVYTEPIPSERAVHNMEHGAVWITYRPDLPAAQVKALRAFVAKQSLIGEGTQTGVLGQRSRYTDLSPWKTDALPSPIVISAWGHQLRVSRASDPRLQKFVDVFRHAKKYTPEYGAAVDGQPVTVGGRAAADGATVANPSSGASSAMS